MAILYNMHNAKVIHSLHVAMVDSIALMVDKWITLALYRFRVMKFSALA